MCPFVGWDVKSTTCYLVHVRAAYDPILFDLDGTLVDSSADIAVAVNRTLDGLGLDRLDDGQIVGFVGDGVRKLMLRTLDRFGRTDVDDAVARFKVEYRDHCLEATRPYPGIAELLEALAGARLGVVTNKPAAFARQILDGLGLQRHFHAVVGGDEAPLKPLPDPVLLALQRLGAQAQGGLMVGDHANDVLSGRAAGLCVCGVTWGFDRGHTVRESDPDHLCDSPAELKTLLKI